jgi:hypothetical protein
MAVRGAAHANGRGRRGQIVSVKGLEGVRAAPHMRPREKLLTRRSEAGACALQVGVPQAPLVLFSGVIPLTRSVHSPALVLAPRAATYACTRTHACAVWGIACVRRITVLVDIHAPPAGAALRAPGSRQQGRDPGSAARHLKGPAAAIPAWW